MAQPMAPVAVAASEPVRASVLEPAEASASELAWARASVLALAEALARAVESAWEWPCFHLRRQGPVCRLLIDPARA